MTISNAYPDILQNGNPADATQVMADFYQIQNDVNANAASAGANTNITSLTGLTTPLGLAYGGTGATSASAALTALGALAIANNLSDVAIPATALANLGGAALSGAAFTGAISVTGNISSTATVYGVNGVFTGAGSFATGLTFPTASYGTNSTAGATTAFVLQAFTGGQSLTGSGYQKLPGGLIFQWGSYTASASDTRTITLPLTFPTSGWYCNVDMAPGTANAYVKRSGFSGTSQITTGVDTFGSGNPTIVHYWVALGY